jgi:undecaprenyl-diphosphatase
MDILQAIFLAIIEGLTEFLPISSTGHMVLASSFMHIAEDDFTKYFEVCIQFGAILSVVVLYFKKFIDLKNSRFYIKLVIAIIPSLILGKFLSDFIDDILGNPVFIAVVMIIGGILLLFVDKLFHKNEIHTEQKIDYLTAFKIGIYQCLSILFPGLSRSAATIVGGMQQKLTRSAAAEFSFFLAVPTLFAATSYKTLTYLKDNGTFTYDQVQLLIIGNLVAFLVALLAIKFFIQFVKSKGFHVFGVYRIIVGSIILILLLTK